MENMKRWKSNIQTLLHVYVITNTENIICSFGGEFKMMNERAREESFKQVGTGKNLSE